MVIAGVNKKIAIQIAGQLRDWTPAEKQFKEIKTLTNADVYLATWTSEYTVDTSFLTGHSIDEDTVVEYSAYRLANRWKRANEIRQRTGIEYDSIIMVRPDAILYENFIENLSEYFTTGYVRESIIGAVGGLTVSIANEGAHNYFMDDKLLIGTPLTIDTLSFVDNEMKRRMVSEVNHYNLAQHCLLHNILGVNSHLFSSLSKWNKKEYFFGIV